LQALLNRRPLLFIARCPYGIYLTHCCCACVTPYALRFLNALGVHDPYLLFAGGAAVTFAATVLLSFVTYHAVERPGIRLGKWFLQRATPLFGARPLPEQEARHVRA
jgi:peptidoglycan/LPS O-acetylase OafA/YrhL